MKPWVSPFSNARPTLSMGHLGDQCAPPQGTHLRFGEAGAPEGRVNVEIVGSDPIGRPTRIVVEQIRRDDIKVVIGGMREGTTPIAVTQGPYARYALMPKAAACRAR